jgi:hypothetical protein
MYVAYSNIVPFKEINAVINYLQNEMYRPGKLSGKTTAGVFSMIHRFIIEGEVAGLKAILPQPSRKDLISPFTLLNFTEGMDGIVNIVKASKGAEPTSVCFLKRYILYYQFITQYCLAQMGMINTYHDVECYSKYYHDPKTFKDGHNLHQFIIRQQYNDLLKAFKSPSLIKEMKSMNVKHMKTAVLPEVLNLAYLKKMCAKQLDYIVPLCCDSVLVPLDPLPANQHSLGKDASSSLSETQLNVDEVSSTLLSAPFPTAPADDDAQGQALAPIPTATAHDEAPVEATALASADIFDINRFLKGFSSSDNVKGRMSEVMNKIAYNKMPKMGVTFVNQGRGCAELVLNKNRHTDCKSLPYLSSVGVVSRKAMPKKARGKKLAEQKDYVDHDEQGGDGDGPKKKGNEVFEHPNRTGRSAQDVKDLLEFKGKDGHGVYTNVVTNLLECHETASFVHDPMLYLSEVKLTTKFYICFTNMPYKKSMRCEKHPYGCGLSLKVGDVVRVYAVEKCHFIKGIAWYIPVHLIQPSGNIGCCVGIAKTFPTQAHILANRTAIVSELVGMTDTSGGDPKETQAIVLLCCHAIATFIDVTVPRNVSKPIESAPAAI